MSITSLSARITDMADKYSHFAELASTEREGSDFLIRIRSIKDASAVIVAPHGGGIEPGTSEIADAIAGEDFSFYAFEGIKSTHNGDLHITSTAFDESQCVALVSSTDRVVTIHGESSAERFVFLGGRDEKTASQIRQGLEVRNFNVRAHDDPMLSGNYPSNICNRGRLRMGVQLEISSGLRAALFESLDRLGRAKPTQLFFEFTTAVKDALVA